MKAILYNITLLTLGLLFSEIALISAKSTTWNGSVSSSYSTSGNWSNGVPDSLDNITINSNAPNNLILTQNQKITNLTINGDTLDLGGYRLEITGTAYFNGGLVKNGLLKPTGSLCHFGGATLDARIEATCGYFHMNSGVYKKPVFLTSTGAATSSSTYGNHFEDSLTITNNGAVYFNMGSSGEDIYDGPVILYNYSSKEIRLAGTDTSYFNNSIYINDSLGGVEFGVSGGVSILASGKTISVGTFSSNYLTLKKFIQLGGTSQTLTLSGTGVVSLENCIFNGNLTINAPGILTKSSTYYGNTTFNRTGSATNFHSYGSNVYHSNFSLDNAGSGGRIRLASSAPDTYLGDATFSSSGGQDVQVAYIGDNSFTGNITINSNKVVFNTSTGKVTFTGTNNQTLNGSYNYTFKNVAINKSSGNVTANSTLSVDDSLIFIQGILVTTSTNLLTMKHGSKTHGASNSSFVSGPVKKVGNSSFTFPIGIGGTYRSLGMSAPSNSSNAYTAEYFNIVQTFGSILDSTIQEISNCDYWSFVNNSGTSPVNLTLSWDSAFCWQFDTTYMNIVYWNSSKWKDIGHGTFSGDILNGTTTSTQQINQFGYFTLAQNSSKPSYSPSFAVLDEYAILAKDSVVSELMYVLGKVGSGGSVDSTISASDSILQSNSGTVAAAMAEAIAIMNDLDSINGTILSNDLSEMNLFEGIYKINGDATLNGTFHLYGDSTSTFVFKISDSLNVSQNSTMELHGVHPKNIFWRIEGHSNLEDSILFYGILLSDSNITVSSNGGQLTLTCETFIDIKNPISENYFKHIRSISNMFIPFQYVSLPTCNAPVFDCNYIINPGLESGAIPNDEDGFQLGWVDCWMNFMCNDGSGCNASPPTGGNNTPDVLDVNATNVFGFRSCTGPGGSYDSFGIPENTMCDNTPALSPSAYATTNTRYSTMFRSETISGTLNKTLEPGFYIAGFYSRATDCMCANQEAAATVCINIFDTPTGTCDEDQIGFMNLWNLNKNTWEYHDACLDLTALSQLSTKNYIGFSMNYPQGTCAQVNYSGRVLVDDFTLTKVADAGPDKVYCGTSGISIGPDCQNPLYTYSYSWTASTGATPPSVQNPIVNPTVTTTYTLTVTMDHPNGMSCFDIDQVTITVVPGFTLSSSSTPATSGNNGTATVNVSGGSPNYDYLWSNGASSNSSSTTNTISGLIPGTYTVTVTDANGCTNTTTIEVESPCASSPLTVSVTPSTLSACSGQNFLLTANISGGTSPFTYQWNLDGLAISGATSQTLTTLIVSSVPDVFTYSVVVTDGNLCTATANATVTINPLPSVSISGGLGICMGQPTTLTAQPSPAGTYTYLWSNSATTAATQISVDGNYTVTVTNSSGCTASQTVAVIDENTSFNIVGNLANCERSVETSVYSIFPYNATNSAYYSWSVSGALTLISVNSSTGEATIEFPIETGGIITVDYNNPITGCSFTTTLYVYDCCRDGESPIIANASTSELLTLLGSTYVNVSGTMVTLTAPGGLYVNGALTLDTDLNIRDCNLKFGPGARILVPPNFELTIDFSYLHAGCDMMWRGIELQGTNSKLITNNININVATEIEDAQYGVLVQNGANYIVWKDVIFKNNFIGMQVNGPTFQTRFVTETEFTCNADLLPMYPGQSPQVCSRSYAGMELNNVFNGINIGDATNMTPQVTFEYLNIGILSRFSNPSIFNSQFNNIRTPGDNACFNAASLLYRGSGIAQLGGTARPASVLFQRGFGMLTTDPVSFNNCIFGIYADNSTIDIQENRMTNVNTGIFERNASPFLQNYILNNKITANNFGVQILDATFASEVKVYFNEITVNNTLGGGQGNRAGVNVVQNNLNFIPGRVAVRNNSIDVENARFGINFSNISNTDALDNIINLTATAIPTKTGIRHTSVNNHSTGCNVINQLGSQANFGVFSLAALNTQIECNITNDLNIGFRVSGNSSGMDFSGNVMNNGNRGLDLANGIMGQQFDQGNQWPNTYPNWGARIMGSDPILNRFTVELPYSTPLWPNSINDITWFVQHTCPNPICADECTIVGEDDYYCESPARISKLNVTLVDSTAVAGDSLTTEYVEEFLWQTRRDLYSDLLLNPSLQDSSSVMEDFVDHHVDSTYAQFAILENYLSNPYVEEMSAFDQVKSYYASIDSLFIQIRQNDSLYFTGLSSLDSLEVLNRNSELRLQIDSIVNLSKDFEILMRSAFEGVIESAYEYNLGLSGSTLPYENNEFQLNRIGLTMQIEKRDTLTEDEGEIIESIASQCIYEGGKVVIRARNLYHFYVNDSIDFEDSTFCGYSYRSGNHLIENQYINSESLQVYPNPANNLLTLVYTSDINAGSAISLSIFDPTGRSVLNKSLNGTTGRYYIDISELNEGIYFVKAKTPNGTKLDHKLVIIR